MYRRKGWKDAKVRLLDFVATSSDVTENAEMTMMATGRQRPWQN